MPRYTSVQVFSDKDTKVVSGYAGGSQGTGDAKASKGKLETEKVIVTTGSCAGAGSGEFDLYRAARNRERERLEQLEKAARQEAEAEVFAIKVQNNKREAEVRTEKNRIKRLKKKAKASQKANTKVKDRGEDSSQDESDPDESLHKEPSGEMEERKDKEPTVAASEPKDS